VGEEFKLRERSESDRKNLEGWAVICGLKLQKWNLLEICQGNHAKADHQSRFGQR
jgi:hypothetical protein